MRAIILLLSAALCCGSAQALVPHQINYQGLVIGSFVDSIIWGIWGGRQPPRPPSASG